MLNTEQINKLILINKDATVKDAWQMNERTINILWCNRFYEMNKWHFEDIKTEPTTPVQEIVPIEPHVRDRYVSQYKRVTDSAFRQLKFDKDIKVIHDLFTGINYATIQLAADDTGYKYTKIFRELKNTFNKGSIKPRFKRIIL
jgi:hypothetical protein